LRAEAAGSYGKVLEMLGGKEGSKLPRLWVEHLRIEQLTTKDSPEFRVATEAALADFEKRGGSDVFEGTMRHELAMSYRKEQQYAKSTELLNANLKKDTGARLHAYDTLWTAMNAQDAHDLATADKLLREVVVRYPETGAAQTAKSQLQKPMYRERVLESKRNSERFWKGMFFGTDVVAIGVLVTIFVGRRLRRKETV